MSRVYVAAFENVAVSVTQDLFEITPDQRVPIRLHSLFLDNLTEVGDAAEEMLRITIKAMGVPTAGSGGTNPAGFNLSNPSEGNPKATIAANNTTKATSAGSTRLIGARGWNVRGPFERVWTPETRPTIGWDLDDDTAQIVVVRLEASPADAINMTGEISFEELGA